MDGTQYVSMQLHAYDIDWSYVMLSTGAVCLPPPHTTPRVASALEDLLLNLGFNGQYRISATTDSGANIYSAVEKVLNHDWLPCFNHLMHLAVTEVLSLPDIAEVIGQAH